MKRFFKHLTQICLVLAALAMVGCTGDTTSNVSNSVNNNDYTKSGNLQGKIMDANTGAPISFAASSYKSSDVQIYLVRGDAIQTPNRWVYDNANVLAGEYAFNGVPYTLANNATYKLVVQITGYQRFESEFQPVAFWGSRNGAAALNGTTTQTNSNNTLDSYLNRIGNIYLYKIADKAVDYKIRVMYNGKPVPAANLALQQVVAGEAPTLTDIQTQVATTNYNLQNLQNANRLFPTSGLLPAIYTTKATDTDGYATFEGANLVLGGYYKVIVYPFKSSTFEGGVQLEVSKLATNFFVVGASSAASNPVNFTILMASSEANNGNTTGGLYITKTEPTFDVANNGPGQSTSLSTNGVLKVYFNRPVRLNDAVSANGYTAPVTGVAPNPNTPENLNYVGFWATLSSDNADFNMNMNATTNTGLLYPYTTAAAVAPALTAYTTTIAAFKPVLAGLDSTNTVLTLTPQFVPNFSQASYFNLRVNYADVLQLPGTPITLTYGGKLSQQNPATVSPLDHPEERYALFTPTNARATHGILNVSTNQGTLNDAVVRITLPRN